jgi:hypothetical protein
MLYDLVACPHRVSMDLFGDSKERDQPSPFVQLLWERGTAHEDDSHRWEHLSKGYSRRA